MKIKDLSNYLLGIIIIPASLSAGFMDIPYKLKTQNKVKVQKTLSIEVDSSASPLFYKLPEIKQFKNLEVSGQVFIDKKITNIEDSYLQLGVVYAGDYFPGSFMKMVLPSWLVIFLTLGGETGIGVVDFYEISVRGSNKYVARKEDKIQGIKVYYSNGAYFSEDGTFQMLINLKPEKVIGLWIKINGVKSNAKFKTVIESLSFK